ncbi:unnamed protein product, partial [Prorocentrum cordatum]
MCNNHSLTDQVLAKQQHGVLKVWADPRATNRFDAFNPKLINAGVSDAEMSDFFVEYTLASGIGQRMRKGASKEVLVQEFSLVAGAVWSELPEDADLGESAAVVLLDGRAAMRALRGFLVKIIDETTDIGIFQEHSRFEQEALRTAGFAAPTQAIGKISKPPTQVIQAVTKVHDQICMTLRAGLIKEASLMDEELLKSKKRKLEQKGSNAEEDERTALMHGRAMSMLSEAIAAWTPALAEHSHGLRDATGACKPCALPEKADNGVYKLSQSIATDAAEKLSFGSGDASRIYDAIDVLAAAWLKSAWRLECATATVEAKLADCDGNRADLDKLARELGQAIQRATEKCMPAALVDMFRGGLNARAENSRAKAEALAVEIGSQVRGYFYKGVTLKATALSGEIDRGCWAKVWAPGRVSVNEMASLLKVAAAEHGASRAQARGDMADIFQSEYATLLQKTVGFSLPPKAGVGATAPAVIRTARALPLEHSFASNFTSEATKRDEIAMQNKMRDIQPSLKGWSLAPEDSPAALAARYRAGLRA